MSLSDMAFFVIFEKPKSNTRNKFIMSLLSKLRLPIFMTAVLMLAASNLKAENKITWQTLGNKKNEKGEAVYTQRLTIIADSLFDGVAYCMFKRGSKTVDQRDSLIEILPGYYLITSERFKDYQPGTPIDIDIGTRGWLHHHAYQPDGMHLVSNGKAVPAENVRVSLVNFPDQWIDPVKGTDEMIYGEEAFIINDSLRSAWRPAPYGSIPTPKNVSYDVSKRVLPKDIRIEKIADDRTDYWKAEITPEGILVKTNSRNPNVILGVLNRKLKESADSESKIPVAVIEDWSDYPYRGFMLDVVRNFQKKEMVLETLDLMNEYGLNVLHFHLGDDEGWRIEMPSLPELTEVGGKRGFTLTNDVPFLKGIYSGDGNPYNPNPPANGYYTVDEYIEILQHADSLGITVIPEFDTPAHSRAAIMAMEYRAKHNGDDSYRLIQDGDTSKYSSAQAYYDNVMNPALEGPYKLWATLFDDLIDIYSKAGVPLKVVNIGGDEVPRGAWNGSEAVEKLKKEKGLEEQREIHAYFVEKVTDIAAEKGLKIMGWQEIALDHSDAYDKKIIPHTYGVNSWTNAGNKGVKMAEKGYPVILSNVDYLYFDQTPTLHPEEPGLIWGGIVSEFSPLHATIDFLIPDSPVAQSNVIGISAHLFAETIRNKGMVERYILPRLLGLSERAHNKNATLSDNEYFGIVTTETDKWAKEGKNVYLRQPGIRVNDGKAEMNNAYGFGEIRYTLDGSDPDAESLLYEGPVSVEGTKEIRARLFHGPAKSVVTILYL